MKVLELLDLTIKLTNIINVIGNGRSPIDDDILISIIIKDIKDKREDITFLDLLWVINKRMTKNYEI